MARVSKIMSAGVPTLGKEAKIEEAARLIAQNDSGCVVITENGAPVGIVTELDIVKNISKGGSLKEPATSIMASTLTVMNPNTKLDEALKIIDTKRYRRYPVVEGGKLAGLVTKKDVVNEISENLRFHRDIQNVVLVLFVLFEFFVFVIYKYLPSLNFFGA